jgi:hypothetical protein
VRRDATQVEGCRMALTDLARVSKLANDAGAVDRLAQITERIPEISELSITPDHSTRPTCSGLAS